jgi:hypothetical protein
MLTPIDRLREVPQTTTLVDTPSGSNSVNPFENAR